MGTNFYMQTKNKVFKNRYFGEACRVVDTPDFGYEIHIAKTSAGWLPLFQESHSIHSVKDIKKLYDTGEFIIYDEYEKVYNWEDFVERVLKFNGGIEGVIPKVIENINPFNGEPKYESVPISHVDYNKKEKTYIFYKDSEGYEFSKESFS